MKEVPYTSNGWVTAALVVAGLLGVAHVGYKANIVRVLYGRGYVPWVKLEWKAKQAASRHGKPLLTFHTDPRHPDNEHLLKLVRAPEVEPMIDLFVWHQVESPAQGREPAPPLLTVRRSSGDEEVLEPFVVDAALTPAGLADKLSAALAAYEAEKGS